MLLGKTIPPQPNFQLLFSPFFPPPHHNYTHICAMSANINNTPGSESISPRQPDGSTSPTPSRTASISLQAAAAVNAGLQHERSSYSRRMLTRLSHDHAIHSSSPCVPVADKSSCIQAPRAPSPDRSPLRLAAEDDPKS